MAKKPKKPKMPKKKVEYVPSVGMDEVLDFIDELFAAGNVVDAVYGFRYVQNTPRG